MEDLEEQLVAWLERQNYTCTMGEWYKGKSAKAISTDKLAELIPQTIRDNYAPKTIKEQLVSIGQDMEEEKSEGGDQQQNLDLDTYVFEFLDKYQRMLLSGWSDVDSTVYDGLKYTINNDAPLILAPTGNGKEYAIIGRNFMDVHTSLAGLPVEGSNINRLKYIENCIVKSILKACFSNGRQNPDVLDPTQLSACVMDSMYTKKAVKDDKILLGYQLEYVGGKPNALDYVKKSLETFLANSDNYIEKVSPISNDPMEPTYRYISLDYVAGDWSAYRKWFNDTFDRPGEVARVMMTHLGAMLDSKNTGKQGGWIRGHGDDAKSTVFNAIMDELGSAAGPIDVSLLKDNAHGWTQLDNLRLGVISDAKIPGAIGESWYHTITGGDNYQSNEKFKTPRKAKAITKIFFLENIEPFIKTTQDNYMSRIIYYRCKQKTDAEKVAAGIGVFDKDNVFHKTGNSNFEKLIRSQTKAFLAECIKVYFSEDTLCPNRAQIMVPNFMTETMIDYCAEEGEELLEYNLDTTVERGTEEDFISRIELHDMIKAKMGESRWHSVVSPQTLKLMLEKKYRSTVVRKRVNGGRVWAYTGVKLKPYLEPKHEEKTTAEVIDDIREKAKTISPTKSEEDMSWAD